MEDILRKCLDVSTKYPRKLKRGKSVIEVLLMTSCRKTNQIIFTGMRVF